MRCFRLGLMLLLLNACAQQPIAPTAVDPTSWSMETKIAFSGPHGSGSGYASFDYTPGLLSGELRGAFGLGKSRIDCNLSYCDISTKDSENRLWLNQGNLELQHNLLLPVQVLPHWLMGDATEDAPSLGWDIEIGAWQVQSGVRLPQSLHLRHVSGNTLKIFVVHWTARP